MNKYDLLKNSIYKNIQELAEFIVDNFKVNNYYDLVDLLADLHNFKVKVYQKNKTLFNEIEKELENK